MKNPDLTIIVPAYNNLDITSRCYASLMMFCPEYRVILVDNGSTEDLSSMKAIVEAHGDTFLRIDDNRGPYVAVNRALDLVDTPLVSVVCNDVVMLPGSMQELHRAVNPEKGLLYVAGAGIIQSKFSFYAVSTQAVLGAMRESRALTPVPGCFSHFVALRDLFDEDQVGRFDERFFVTFGDTDWEQRFADLGGQPYVLSSAPMYHGLSTTRKREGVESDIKNDSADHEAFREKWRDRQDVLEKHPKVGDEEHAFGTARHHQRGER